jgi:hypothetical protein
MDAGASNDNGSIIGSAADQRDHIAQFLDCESNTVLGSFGLGLGIAYRRKCSFDLKD